ncbi:MAG: hypothetical protein GTN82_02725 [Candidatus Aminicenantes bacterium]|nr:hypothetical protein [Candidatus Aminicenantes bacterium]
MDYPLEERIGNPALFTGRKQEVAYFLKWINDIKTRRGQVIYLPKMFRIDEKLEFKSDNSTTITNNIPGPIS